MPTGLPSSTTTSALMRFSSRMAIASPVSMSGSIVFGVRVMMSSTMSPPRFLSRLRARSPSVMMPASLPSVVDDADAAEPLPGQGHDGVAQRAAERGDRHAVAPMHDLAHLHQAGAELAARMEGAEMVGREAARLQQRDGQRIADDELQQRRGGRGQPVRAGLRHARQEQHDIRLARQRRRFARGDGDERNGEAPGIGDDALELGALAGPGHGDDGVVLGDHAEVAMIGLRRMHEEGRRAGRGKRRGDLGADMAAFADAGDDDAAPDRRNQLDGAGESIGKAVVQGFGKRGYARLFGGDRSQR